MAKKNASGNVEPLDRAKEKADEVLGKAREGYDTAKERLHHLGEEAGKRYEKLSGDVRRGAERASAVAQQRYKETSETLRTGYTKVRKDLDGLTSDVNTYVRDNPGRSVLIAAAVGFLLGLLFRGRGGREE